MNEKDHKSALQKRQEESEAIAFRMKVLFNLPQVDDVIVNYYNKLEQRWKELNYWSY